MDQEVRVRTPLHLTVDREVDFISAVRFGDILHGRPGHDFEYIGEHIRIARDHRSGRPLGFQVRDFHSFDVDNAPVWKWPFFRIPCLGLERASVGLAVIAARAQFDEFSSMDASCAWQALVEGQRDDLEGATPYCTSAEFSWSSGARSKATPSCVTTLR
jgi:hypothetical protein